MSDSNNQDLFDCCVQIIEAASQLTLSENVLEGELVVDATIAVCIEILGNENLVKMIMDNGKSFPTSDCMSHINSLVKFEIENPPPGITNSYIVNDFDDLLSRYAQRVHMPERVYLISERKYYPKTTNIAFENYQKATNFITLLSELSDFEKEPKLTFLLPERVDLEIDYDCKDLESSKLTRVGNATADMCPDIQDNHTQRVREIFISTVMHYARKIPERDRMGAILKHFDDLYSEYRRDYDLYAADFTFNKIKEELIEKKAKNLERMNEVLQGISTKVLTIPIAYILIAGQLQDQDDVKNHIIFSGASLFALIMILIISSQLLTIRHIKQDVDKLRVEYSQHFKPDILKGLLSQLSVRGWVQIVIMWLVIIVIIGILIPTYYLYSKFTDPTLVEIFMSWASQLFATD